MSQSFCVAAQSTREGRTVEARKEKARQANLPGLD